MPSSVVALWRSLCFVYIVLPALSFVARACTAPFSTTADRLLAEQRCKDCNVVSRRLLTAFSVVATSRERLLPNMYGIEHIVDGDATVKAKCVSLVSDKIVYDVELEVQ